MVSSYAFVVKEAVTSSSVVKESKGFPGAQREGNDESLNSNNTTNSHLIYKLQYCGATRPQRVYESKHASSSLKKAGFSSRGREGARQAIFPNGWARSEALDSQSCAMAGHDLRRLVRFG